MTEEIDLTQLSFGKLELAPGDVLVVQCPEKWSDPDCLEAARESVEAVLQSQLGRTVPVLTIPAGTNLSTAALPPEALTGLVDAVGVRLTNHLMNTLMANIPPARKLFP